MLCVGCKAVREKAAKIPHARIVSTIAWAAIIPDMIARKISLRGSRAKEPR
jgi:hypothetical protein